MAVRQPVEIVESEFSDDNILPSAPPRDLMYSGELVRSGSGSPPRYDAVFRDPQARRKGFRSRGLTSSMARAGATVGRFFGIHDDELQGWNRVGTLQPNHLALHYNPVPQYEESIPIEVTPPPSSPSISISPAQLRARERFKRQQNQEPSRREVMKTLPSFWPVVTILIALVEVGLLIASIFTGGLAPIKFTPENELSILTGFDNREESVSKEIVPNFFIGTSKLALVHIGAMYTPCMRENLNFQIQAAKDRLEENKLRCCRSKVYDQCGMLPQQICTNFYEGQVLGGASSCRSEKNSTCVGGVTLHPCCVGLLGECVITTKQNCTFQGGFWHSDKLLCSEVGTDCFLSICEFTWIGKTIGQVPSQGIRFFSAMFLYDGVITLLIVGFFKLYNSWSIEKRIGWLRILCIYIISGIGGFLLSGILDPTSVSVGGTGGLFGLIGVTLVELLQGWKWVHRPFLELFKILMFIIILLLLGALPYIDNFTQIGGFIFGVLASFIFVPYISIGKWDRFKKLCLLSITLPMILTLFLVGFVVFYNVSDPNFCPFCSYINCIPITETFCDDYIINFLSTVPADG